LANDFDMQELFDNIAIAGKNDSDIAEGTERAGQGS
jgi:hypothetical protein